MTKPISLIAKSLLLPMSFATTYAYKLFNYEYDKCMSINIYGDIVTPEECFEKALYESAKSFSVNIFASVIGTIASTYYIGVHGDIAHNDGLHLA